MPKGHRHIAALDIGTTEVRLIASEVTENDKLEIVGIGRADSRGVRKGVVVNIEATVEAIKRAVEDAEMMSGLPIDQVYVGLAGAQLQGINSRGVIAISRRNREISEEDVYRVIEQARAVSVPTDREIIDVLPQEFTVDGQDGIGNPIGFLGMRLEAAVHVMTSPITARQNVITSVNRAGMMVTDTVVSHVAVVESTLTPDEKEFGAAVIDIGADITNLTIVYRDAIRHTAVFPIGGSHFTNDIAVGLRTPVPEAERIKRSEGCALAALMADHERTQVVEVPSVGGRQPKMLSRQILCEILQPRAEEIFGHVFEEIQRAGFERQVLSSVVLVGGGSLMDGVIDMAEQVLDLPARPGTPDFVGGLSGEVGSPAYASAVGIMLYGFHKQMNMKKIHSLKDGAPKQPGFFRRIIGG
ncbi:MAG TPA: cell division protein FtsA [Blastocatellia bacterium]|jgi:cell division protein FtsA|nr:cell division protein FtsA [Blastocatellia bacterium]